MNDTSHSRHPTPRISWSRRNAQQVGFVAKVPATNAAVGGQARGNFPQQKLLCELNGFINKEISVMLVNSTRVTSCGIMPTEHLQR